MPHNVALHAARTVLGRVLRYSSSAVILFLLLISARAQTTTTPRDGYTPAGLQAGAPAGSYALSGFDNVNLYNGALNFRLPLVSIGGRGGASHTIMLPIEQHWLVEHYEDDQTFSNSPVSYRTDALNIDYGAGRMTARFGGSQMSYPCPTPTPPAENDDPPQFYHSATITRLTFTAPDGTETVFLDTKTGGQMEGATGECPATNFGYDRGYVFASDDGSGATFVSDYSISDYVLVGSPTEYGNIYGYMMLRDGTRYRIDNGQVTWVRDRNGNKIAFSYDGYGRVGTITDSLDRQVTITYDSDQGSPYGTCDVITYKGYGGATRTIRVSKMSLGNALRSGFSLTSPGYLFPGLQGSTSTNYNPTVASSVWLPDSDGVTRRYQFQYNSYGELARVVLPTGGAYEYDYGKGTTDATTEGVVDLSSFTPQIYRRVTERRVYPDGASGSSYASKSTYSVPETYGTSSTLGYVVVEQRDAGGSLLAKSKHYFQGPGAGITLWHDPTDLPSLTDGKEYKTELLDTNGTTVLRRTEQTWVSGSSFGQGPYVSQTVTTLEPAGANLVAKQTFSWDRYNNQTDVYDYDYGSGSYGSLIRHTATTYVTTNNSYDYACSPTSTCSASASMANVIHIRSLPSQVSVYDAGGTERARTTFEYDNYSTDSTHAGLVDRSSISGLDSSFTTSYGRRGNATATTRYLLSGGSVTARCPPTRSTTSPATSSRP